MAWSEKFSVHLYKIKIIKLKLCNNIKIKNRIIPPFYYEYAL